MASKPKPLARPPLAALKDVRLADGPVQLFEGVDLALEPRVRACLVGRNGAGKSTLMRILAGLVQPDEGERFMQPGARIAMVLQEPEIVGETLLDYATAGGALDYRAETELETFGLDPQKPTVGLSGGETRRAALARAFAEEPDLILLDEPTNHLDIFAIQTLEQELASSGAAALIVSHDRAFLERVTQRCFWLSNRKVRTLDEGFSTFEAWAEKIEEEEAEQLRRLSKAIERETYTFYRSITARRSRNEGRAAKLEAMRGQHALAMREQRRDLQMAVDSGETSGRLVAEAKHISKAWGEKVVAKDLSTRILRGDRIAIVGPNGAGKTTLVRVLLGEIAPDSGEVRLGANLQVAYLDQSRADLNEETTLWEVLAPGGGDSILVRGQSRHVAAYAKEFLFKDSQLRQPVRTLSGGERNRLLLARALAKPANLMVLDEPTNDLDMDTLDLLEELLEDYDGTLILVSHDRDFIDRLATSTIALDGRGNTVEAPGGWQDLLRQNPDFFGSKSPAKAARGASAKTVEAPKRMVKLSYKDQRRLEELEALVERLPAEIVKREAELEDPNLYARDPKGFDRLMAQLDKMRADLANAEVEWFELEEKKAKLAD